MEGLFYLVTVFSVTALAVLFNLVRLDKKSPLGIQAGNEEGALGLIDS